MLLRVWELPASALPNLTLASLSHVRPSAFHARSVPADLQRRAAEAARREMQASAAKQAAAAAAYSPAPYPVRAASPGTAFRSDGPGGAPFTSAPAYPPGGPTARPSARPSSSASSYSNGSSFTPLDSPLLDELGSVEDLMERLGTIRSHQARETKARARGKAEQIEGSNHTRSLVHSSRSSPPSFLVL